jgi:acetylornithine deacetylase/succinyl-diaminopimelate desuccinylase family protein
MASGIIDLAESQREETIKLLAKLIAKDTTNPPGNEWKAAKVAKEFFESNRIKYRIFEKEKGRTNILGYIGTGKPRIIIACHSDVVPAGHGWKTMPFSAKVSGDKMYGRGSVDNKGPLAGMLIAGKMLKKLEPRLKGQVILGCIADEERGSLAGMKYLLDEGKLKGEYAIVPDIGRALKGIDVAEKGLLFLRVTSFGKQVHGSMPGRGVNAIWNMLDFLELLKKYRMKSGKHALLSAPTLNLGTIKGGSAPNMVPGECEAQIDIRYLPSQNAESMVRDVRRMFADVRKKNAKARFSLEVVDHQKPIDLAADNELVRAIKKHARHVTGSEARPIGIGGTTLVKPLSEKGIIAVGFSPGNETAHMANEFISIKEITDFSKILCLVCLEMLS